MNQIPTALTFYIHWYSRLSGENTLVLSENKKNHIEVKSPTMSSPDGAQAEEMQP